MVLPTPTKTLPAVTKRRHLCCCGPECPSPLLVARDESSLAKLSNETLLLLANKHVTLGLRIRDGGKCPRPSVGKHGKANNTFVISLLFIILLFVTIIIIFYYTYYFFIFFLLIFCCCNKIDVVVVLVDRKKQQHKHNEAEWERKKRKRLKIHNKNQKQQKH